MPLEALGKAMARDRRRARARTRSTSSRRASSPRSASSSCSTGARAPSSGREVAAARARRRLLARPGDQRRDGRRYLRDLHARGLPAGAAHQQRARVGAALARDAPGRRALRARGRLGLRGHAQARRPRSTSSRCSASGLPGRGVRVRRRHRGQLPRPRAALGMHAVWFRTPTRPSRRSRQRLAALSGGSARRPRCPPSCERSSTRRWRSCGSRRRGRSAWRGCAGVVDLEAHPAPLADAGRARARRGGGGDGRAAGPRPDRARAELGLGPAAGSGARRARARAAGGHARRPRCTGRRSTGAAVAVKVRRPGLAEAVRGDLGAAGCADAGAVERCSGRWMRARCCARRASGCSTTSTSSTPARRSASSRGPAGGSTAWLRRRCCRSLAAPGVLVSELLDGPTLASGAPDDPGAVARALIASTWARRGGRARSRRPAGRERGAARRTARRAARRGRRARGRPGAGGRGLEALGALRASDRAGFVAAVQGLALLPAEAADDAYDLLDELAGDLVRDRSGSTPPPSLT